MSECENNTCANVAGAAGDAPSAEPATHWVETPLDRTKNQECTGILINRYTNEVCELTLVALEVPRCAPTMSPAPAPAPAPVASKVPAVAAAAVADVPVADVPVAVAAVPAAVPAVPAWLMEECIGSTTGVFDVDRLIDKYHLNSAEIAILKELTIDTTQQRVIWGLEQRSPEWLQARLRRFTMSNAGALADHNKYKPAYEAVRALLWEHFEGNDATRHGTECEPKAEEGYLRYHKHRIRVEHYGLLVPTKHPWMGVSVDGLAFDPSMPAGQQIGLVEYKCPYPNPAMPWKRGRKLLYPAIPTYYYDQIQGAMNLLNLPWCDFVVWTEQFTQVRRFARDPVYWEQVLYPSLERVYMTTYLPRLVWQQTGVLQSGEMVPGESVTDQADHVAATEPDSSLSSIVDVRTVTDAGTAPAAACFAAVQEAPDDQEEIIVVS